MTQDESLETVLAALVAELAGGDTDTVALALAGSHARGTASPYSDVDIIRYAETLPAAESDRYTLRYQGGHLVSLSTTTLAAKRDELARPEAAIFAVPGLRQVRILHDPTGGLAALHQAARDFAWEPLRAAATAYAGEAAMGFAEEAHKILGCLARRDESGLVYATMGMVLGLTRAVAVARGILIESENAFFRQVQESVGMETAWTRAHRRAAGFDRGTARLAPATARAIAALHLYRETAYLLLPACSPAQRGVVGRALEVIAASGLAVSW